MKMKSPSPLLIAFALMLGVTISAFAQDSETRDVGSFEALKVSHGIKVILVEGEEGVIKVKTRSFDPDDVSTNVVSGMLKIKFRSSSLFDLDEDDYKPRRVTVEVPYHGLAYMEAGTGALITGDVVIKEEELIMESSMGAEIDLAVAVEVLELESSMGSIVQLEGSAETAEIQANMGAVIDCEDLTTDYLRAKASMGADLKATARREADASAGMGGVVRIYGQPDKQYISKSFGGEVRIN